jgi:hypothetical protein
MDSLSSNQYTKSHENPPGKTREDTTEPAEAGYRRVSGLITSTKELKNHRKIRQRKVLVERRIGLCSLKTECNDVPLPKLIVLFAVHGLHDTCIGDTSSKVVFVNDLYSVVQLIKISDSPCSRDKDIPYPRTHVWLTHWTLADIPASINLLEPHPNKSRLLFVFGKEDGKFVIIVRTGLHKGDVLLAK